MTQQAVEAFRRERDALLDVVRSLSDEEWHAPSDCAGWRVQDVVTHMACGLQLLVDPANASLPTDPSDMEAEQEKPVAARADWSPAEALAFYEDIAGRAPDALGFLQNEGMATTELDMGNLGKHPMHLLANAFAFDAWCHLRIDILRPQGPIDRPHPANDAERMGPIVEWLLAGLPYMCTAALKPVTTRPWVLHLDGPGGGEWTISPVPAADVRAADVTPGADPDAVAAVTSHAATFIAWSTTRQPWREHVRIEGDEGYATRVLDAIDLI